MRVSTITRNDKDGLSTESFTYDANGDVLEHRISRGSDVGLVETFHYDALGRIYQRTGQHGQLASYTYDGNANTLSVTNAIGHRVRYEYDPLDRVSKRIEDDVPVPPAVPAEPPTLLVPPNSTDGAYTVSWNQVSGATSYPLQMQVNGGDWSTVQSSGGTSWAASGQATGTYGYRIQACNVSGCGAWSATASTSVANLDPAKNPIGINGKVYGAVRWIKTGSGNAGIGFDIANGTTWQVTRSLVGNAHEVVDSGPLPNGAVTVQYTWTDAGISGGNADSRGSITNPAASPVPFTGNVWTFYVTDMFNFNTPERGHQYNLRVDFFDASGRLISTSTCLLYAEIQGNA